MPYLVLLAILGGPVSAPPPLTVSAAISLSDALGEIAERYQEGGGTPIRFNVAGSNVLARQIVNGAPVDVFISADHAQMQVVEQAGAIREGSRRIIVANRLVVAARQERLDEVREAFSRAGPAIRRLAIGDPAAVPAGVYARAALERQGLWRTYEDRIVPTGNVRAALAAVENGSADAAIVYVTDVLITRTARVALTIPLGATPPITYPAAIIASSTQPVEAERWMTFLESDAARAIFQRHGFLPPPAR